MPNTLKRQTNSSEKKDFESVQDILKKKIEQKSPVYAKHEFQDYGIRLSEDLHDKKHKSLYIKLAKNYNEQKLIALAKDVSERKNIRNKGAYFMRLLTLNFTPAPKKPKITNNRVGFNKRKISRK